MAVGILVTYVAAIRLGFWRQCTLRQLQGIGVMASRQGLPEDLMDFALRIPPRAGIALAAISWMIFHAIAVQTGPVVSKAPAESLTAIALHSAIYASALFLQLAVPFCLLIGVSVSLIKRYKAKRILAISRGDPAKAIAELHWRDFERLLGAAFRAQGFEVCELGGPGPDGGVDLVLSRNRKRYLVQCKHWKAWQVGVSVVRELNGVIAAQKADGGYVITSGHFSPDALDFVESCQIILIDGAKLQIMIGAVAKPAPTNGNANSQKTVQAPECPNCGAPMMERVAGQGQFKGQKFWGCSTYPKCRAKLHIERAA
jgi:restriction system protein